MEKSGKILTACEYHTMVKEQGEKTLDLNDTERNKVEVQQEISELQTEHDEVKQKIKVITEKYQKTVSNSEYKALEESPRWASVGKI